MIAALLPAILPAVTDIVGRFLPEDKEERAKAERKIEAELASHLAKVDLAQMSINKEEAKSGNVFIAGWRPFIGWTCGVALAWHFVLAPFTMFICAYLNVVIPELPQFDMGSLMTVLMGMLGLGGLRTFEKYKKITK